MILSNVIISMVLRLHNTAAGYGYAVAANNSGIGQTLPDLLIHYTKDIMKKHYDTKICR